jgi:hypothetical protein
MESPLFAVECGETPAITMPEHINNVKSIKWKRYVIPIRGLGGFACREMATMICGFA